MTNLGGLGGGSTANGINNLGRVVGGSLPANVSMRRQSRDLVLNG